MKQKEENSPKIVLRAAKTKSRTMKQVMMDQNKIVKT